MGMLGQDALGQQLDRLRRSFHGSSACACRVTRAERLAGERIRGRRDKQAQWREGLGIVTCPSSSARAQRQRAERRKRCCKGVMAMGRGPGVTRGAREGAGAELRAPSTAACQSTNDARVARRASTIGHARGRTVSGVTMVGAYCRRWAMPYCCSQRALAGLAVESQLTGERGDNKVTGPGPRGLFANNIHDRPGLGGARVPSYHASPASVRTSLTGPNHILALSIGASLRYSYCTMAQRIAHVSFYTFVLKFQVPVKSSRTLHPRSNHNGPNRRECASPVLDPHRQLDRRPLLQSL
jgi:hypothetical protein